MVCVTQIRDSEKVLRMPFASVRPGQPAQSEDLKRRMSAIRKFVPWKGSGNFVPMHLRDVPEEDPEAPAEDDSAVTKDEEAPKDVLPPGIEPLVLWRPGTHLSTGCSAFGLRSSLM
jgi:hypothetical protein